MTSYSEHLANLSHSGGLPRAARQGESSAALLAAVEALRKNHVGLLAEIEAMRKQQAVEKRNHTTELEKERVAFDAELREERAVHDARVRQLAEILRSEFGQHGKRVLVIERQMVAIDEVLAR
jgi:hypothetical protein